MTLLVPITMFGYPLVVLLLFMLLPPRRAVIASFLSGWLLLPNAGYGIAGLPAYTKMSACCMAPMLGAVLFDLRRITSFRPRWFDLPILLWCICPLFSSLSNQLGLYDGLSGAFRQTVTWGLPYFMGRVYMGDLPGLRSLAVALFVAGLILVPLCLFEMRMSPKLHSMLYGFRFGERFDVRRFGGYRPSVFLQSGIALGAWMTVCSVTAVWLWANRTLRRLWRISTGWLAGILLAVTVLCRSLGGIILLVLGLTALFAAKWARTRAPVLVLVAIAPLYISARASGLWSGGQLVQLAGTVSAARAASLKTRLVNEDALVEKALRHPLFGWGAWGRYRVRDEAGRDNTLADGLWVQALGKNGLAGLASLTAALLLSPFLLALRYPPKPWSPPLAPAIALATVSVLYMLDSLPNAGENPVFVLAVGGISGFCARRWSPAAARAFAPAERSASAERLALCRGAGRPT